MEQMDFYRPEDPLNFIAIYLIKNKHLLVDDETEWLIKYRFKKINELEGNWWVRYIFRIKVVKISYCFVS